MRNPGKRKYRREFKPHDKRRFGRPVRYKADPERKLETREQEKAREKKEAREQEKASAPEGKASASGKIVPAPGKKEGAHKRKLKPAQPEKQATSPEPAKPEKQAKSSKPSKLDKQATSPKPSKLDKQATPPKPAKPEKQARTLILPYRLADKAEARKLLMSNKAYYDGFSKNDLQFRLGSKYVDMDDYKELAQDQMKSFTRQEAILLEEAFADIEKKISEESYRLPPIDEITIIKTTGKEECGVAGYTHGTQIYLRANLLSKAATGDKATRELFDKILCHELFHCFTRHNPAFRRDMYKIIHFTVVDQEYKIPPSVFEYHISNPDVEHHDSYASFKINGQMIKCFTDFVTTRHFQRSGDKFFDCSSTALVPVDGSDVYYSPEDAENFDDIFGKNTGYVIDPEECLADNFAFALYYGRKGPEGKGYPNPEIIDAILNYLS